MDSVSKYGMRPNRSISQAMSGASSRDLPDTQLSQIESDLWAKARSKTYQPHLLRSSRCFTGRKIVDLLLDLNYANDREAAISIGNVLCRRGALRHVLQKNDFKDDHSLFRLAPAKKLPRRQERLTERKPDGVNGIALVAHNNLKDTLLAWVVDNKEKLSHHTLFATGTTGSIIARKTGLNVRLLRSGPLGGDQQIGAMIAEQKINTLIFFWDPMTAQPHDSDVKALLRLAVMCDATIAMNVSTANCLV